MAPFDLAGEPADDYVLVRDGSVTLFRQRETLDETGSTLTGLGYRVTTLDAASWTGPADFHRDIKAALAFPDYYGNNLDAFNDCLRDVATYQYGASPADTGTVLALTGYDKFAGRHGRAAHAILDIYATQARFAMLFGHRMLCLVQSDDPDLSFAPVGGQPVSWYETD